MKKKLFFMIIFITILIVISLLIFSFLKHQNDNNSATKVDTNQIEKIDNKKQKTQKVESYTEEEIEEPKKDEEQETKKEKNEIDIGVTIELNGDEEMTVNVGSTFKDPGAKAKNGDGKDISDKIKIEGEVDTKTPGTYRVYYSIGKAIVVREVEVK